MPPPDGPAHKLSLEFSDGDWGWTFETREWDAADPRGVRFAQSSEAFGTRDEAMKHAAEKLSAEAVEAAEVVVEDWDAAKRGSARPPPTLRIHSETAADGRTTWRWDFHRADCAAMGFPHESAEAARADAEWTLAPDELAAAEVVIDEPGRGGA